MSKISHPLKLLSNLILTLFLLSCSTNSKNEISFLSFNIWQEGTSVPNGLEKIRDVILETNPDVVCFTEVRNYNNQDWTHKIIKALAEKEMHYYRGYVGGDVSFISKYPLDNGKHIFDDKSTIVSFNLTIDGKNILIAGAHLDYTYYANYLPRGYNGSDPNWELIDDGNGKASPVTDITKIQNYNLKSTRDEAIDAFLKAVSTEEIPVILMGDFNEPSFLDWTSRTKDLFDHNSVDIAWRNTEILDKNGFIDAYRSYFPDEVKNPGFTWPSFANDKKSTSWTPLADERDRIDYIFFKGKNISIEELFLVGPKQSYRYNRLTSENTEDEHFIADKLPWPSDHKALFVNLLFEFEN